MEQVILGGTRFYALDTSATPYYNTLMGGNTWSNLENRRYQVVPCAGTLSNLRLKLSAAPGAGKSYTFVVRKNGADTDITVTISDANTTGADTAHTVSVAAGDTVGLESVGSGTPDAASAIYTTKFTGNSAEESMLLGSTATLLNVSATEYNFVVTGNGGMFADEPVRYEVIPTPGKIKNFYVKLDIDPGTSPDAYRFTLRVNGANSDDGEGNPLQVTITANDTTGSDTTHEIPVSAGDKVDIMVEPLNTPSATPVPAWGMCFKADTDGESLILNGDADDLSVSAAEYHDLCGVDLTWDATEADRQMLIQECTLKKLYIYISTPPGDGKSYALTLRQNSGASSLTVTISGASDQAGNDTAHDVSVSNDDEMSLESSPTGTPTATEAFWGLVGYIEPPKVQPGGGIVVDAVLAGLI